MIDLFWSLISFQRFHALSFSSASSKFANINVSQEIHQTISISWFASLALMGLFQSLSTPTVMNTVYYKGDLEIDIGPIATLSRSQILTE
jgi:hypothetical protein